MPKRRLLTTPSSGYTNIRASIACHTLRVYKSGDRDTKLTYKLKNDGTVDGFTTEFVTDDTDSEPNIVTLRGNGFSGILGRPPNYAGTGRPTATAASSGDSGGGDVILMVKAASGAVDLIIEEDESQR